MAGLKKGKGSSKSKGGQGKGEQGECQAHEQLPPGRPLCRTMSARSAAMRHTRCSCSGLTGKGSVCNMAGKCFSGIEA